MKRHPQSGRRERVYGLQPVRELLRAGRRRCLTLYLSASGRHTTERDEIEALAAAAGVAIRRREPAELPGMPANAHHQGVAADVEAYPYVPFEAFRATLAGAAAPPLVLMLDHLQDPQNLGSILRTADAVGVTGVLIPADRAAGVTEAAVRASSGAAEHVRVVRVTNLVRSMQALKDNGLWIAGLEGASDAKVYTAADLKGPIGLVVGAEGRGLGRLVRETCDFLIRLPMRGGVSSLNAGVAAGIALYEILRQRSPAA